MYHLNKIALKYALHYVIEIIRKANEVKYIETKKLQYLLQKICAMKSCKGIIITSSRIIITPSAQLSNHQALLS